MKQTLEQAAGDYIVQLNGEDLEGGFNAAFNAFKAGAEWQKKQKPLKYFPKEKVYDIMSKLTNLSFSERFPINSEEYKKINEITSDVRDLLNYFIEQKPKK